MVTTLCKQRGFSRLCEENLCSSNEVMISGGEVTGEVITVELGDPWRLTSASSHHPEVCSSAAGSSVLFFVLSFASLLDSSYQTC